MPGDQDLTIIPLILTTGERLPCLVSTATWLPVKLATRWLVCHRRYRVQSNTLRDNLYAIRRLYIWATRDDIPLESLLLSGENLTPRQLEALVNYLRASSQARHAPVVSPNTVNKALYAIEDFLLWSLDQAWQPHSQSAEQHIYRLRFTETLRSLRYSGNPSRRYLPLNDADVSALRLTLAPQPQPDGTWKFPDTFSLTNALRNWLMVEMALELGLRIGELLKLRLDSLPRGTQQLLLVRRHPDDPYDTRTHEPAVKTAERGLPLSPPLLTALRAYITRKPPWGRSSGNSPYLFVTDEGQPLSQARANDILAVVSQHSGVAPLSWHRFRHTWAERMAVYLLDVPNGLDQLMYLGGWTNPQSPQRYIQNAVAAQAQNQLRTWQNSLYPEADER
jgi:integrase